MEKRALERLSVNLQARLFYGNMVYTGTVSNLTESGMFICTEMSFPVDTLLVSVILLDGHTLKIPVVVRRTLKSNNHPEGVKDNGIGVGLLNPPAEYMDFVSTARASL